jgi:enterochelin esterase-like enzyme
MIGPMSTLRAAFLIVLAAGCGGGAAQPAVDAPLPDAAPGFAPVPGTTTVLSQTITVGARAIVVYVPAFAYDPAQATWLLLNDGQDTGALGLTGTLDAMWKDQTLAPMVVIALPVAPGGDRLQDYGTAEHDVSIPCDPGNPPLLGTKAAEYGQYVIRDALPAAERAVGATPAPAKTGLLGASLGGLSALAIAWDHPETFGFAGAMSGSFWWRTMSGTVEQRQSSRIMPAIIARAAPHPGFRVWFEAGTNDETADRDGDGIIDAIDDTLDTIAALNALGFQTGKDVVYREVQGGIHGYPTWAAVLPELLTWAAPR